MDFLTIEQILKLSASDISKLSETKLLGYYDYIYPVFKTLRNAKDNDSVIAFATTAKYFCEEICHRAESTDNRSLYLCRLNCVLPALSSVYRVLSEPEKCISLYNFYISRYPSELDHEFYTSLSATYADLFEKRNDIELLHTAEKYLTKAKELNGGMNTVYMEHLNERLKGLDIFISEPFAHSVFFDIGDLLQNSYDNKKKQRQMELERKRAEQAPHFEEIKARLSDNPVIYHFGTIKCKVVAIDGMKMKVMFRPHDVRSFDIAVFDCGTFTFKHK